MINGYQVIDFNKALKINDTTFAIQCKNSRKPIILVNYIDEDGNNYDYLYLMPAMMTNTYYAYHGGNFSDILIDVGYTESAQFTGFIITRPVG